MLKNPFYAGVVQSKGVIYPGSHTPVVTMAQFESVQRLLSRPTSGPKRYSFPFTGLINCGACGLIVTAEHKRKPSGRRYVYYHCSHNNRGGPKCRQGSVEQSDLKHQLRAFITRLALHPKIEPWVWDRLDRAAAEDRELERVARASVVASVEQIDIELKELIGLRLRGVIGDDELVLKRNELQVQRSKLEEKASQQGPAASLFEPARKLVAFSVLAADLFETGDDDDLRLLVKTASSNRTLTDKTVSIQAAKPFVEIRDFLACLTRRGRSDADRTLPKSCVQDLRVRARALNETLLSDEYSEVLQRVTSLLERHEVRKRARAA